MGAFTRSCVDLSKNKGVDKLKQRPKLKLEDLKIFVTKKDKDGNVIHEPFELAS